jgi:hypothetical protein
MSTEEQPHLAYVNEPWAMRPASQGPRVIIHRLEGHTVTETWYQRDGQLLCDCVIRDAAGEYKKRYRKLEDALSYVRAAADMRRIREEP